MAESKVFQTVRNVSGPKVGWKARLYGSLIRIHRGHWPKRLRPPLWEYVRWLDLRDNPTSNVGPSSTISFCRGLERTD